VVAGNEFFEPSALGRVEHRRHGVQLIGQQGRGSRDVHGRFPALAAPGIRVGEQHDPQHRHFASSGAQELLQQVGRLIELDARRAATAVAEAAACDQVPGPVELLEPPVVTVAVHGRVEMLALDRDQSRRAE